MKKTFRAITLVLILCLGHNGITQAQDFAKGADISWLTEMEATGKKFYNSEGVQTECMTLLKSLDMNAVRLRVWVNPTDGWCNAADLLVKARRASNLGMRIMIDFHYSDSWADPSKQTKPAAWTTYDLNGLKTAVANHTRDVLTLLKNNQIAVEWVQVGNETGNGMLWETGKASVSMSNYAALTTAGYDAVKEVYPNAKVIVHIHNGYDNNLFRWIFDGLKNNGGKWDIIGMSLYPSWYTVKNDWQSANNACLANMNDMVTRYNKEVMIVECGMSWDMAATAKSFLTDLISKTKQVKNGMGTGVFYWEPQSYGNWKGYTLGAFDNSGRPTVALDAFRNITETLQLKAETFNIHYNKTAAEISFDERFRKVSVISAAGKIVLTAENTDSIATRQLSPGTYIVNALAYSGKESKAKVLLY